jgi:hypothetical protein
VEHGEDERPFVVISVGDSPESRLFIELSSYGSDLAEARDALNLAIRGVEEGSALADPSRYLVGLAVVAYCRTVLHSNVRGRLTDHVNIPDKLVGIHDRVKTYRNATVAHSQSELAVTYAVGILDSETFTVRDVTGPTVVVPLPNHMVHEFKGLVDVMERRLDEAIEPVRASLMKRLARMDRSRLEAAMGPQIQEKWAHEFDPKTKRARYPTGHTVYWDVVPGDPSHE